jgi:hypothetical protein
MLIIYPDAQCFSAFLFSNVTKGLIYRKLPPGSFSTLLHFFFIQIFVYCITIVQIANKVGLKNNIIWNTIVKLFFKHSALPVRATLNHAYPR